MAILSKLLLLDYTMTFNCYELGHTWTPFCSRAAIDIGSATFIEAAKMYAALYIANQLISRKFDSHSTVNTLRSILQSSIFLGFNAYSVLLIFCASRQFMGKFYYLFAAHVPAVIGSYLSILLERKSRRSALSFYVANIASETLWNKFVDKGWMKPLPAGETILFALSTASFLYLIHSQGRYGRDPVSFAFKFLLGSDFLAPSPTPCKIVSQDFTQDQCDSEELLMLQDVNQSQATSDQNAPRHPPHRSHHRHHQRRACNSQANCDNNVQAQSNDGLVAYLLSASIDTDSCLVNVLHGFIRSGMIAYVGNSLVTLVMRSHKFTSKPLDSIVNAFLYNHKSRQLALFTACFTGLFKASHCVNCWLETRDETATSGNQVSRVNPAPVKTFVNALLASSSMLLYRSPKMAQYMLWKLIDTLYFRSVKSQKVKYVDFTLNMLYAVSTAHLFYVAVMEPKLIPKSYSHWLNKVTRGSFAHLNRNIINVFGTESTYGYPTYYPEIDVLQPQFISDKFKESVLVWML